MESAAWFYYGLFAAIILAIRIGLFKLFQKAGEAGWKAFVPVYSDVVWLKLIGKPLWWIVLTLIPLVRTLIKISMDIELVKAYGKHKFGQQALAVLVPFYYFPRLGFDDKTQYKGIPLTFEEAKDRYEKEGTATGEKVKKSITKSELDKYFNVMPEKSSVREWGDAFLFAGVAALIIRTFFIEAFMIPTSSMERTLMAGDFLFVSKFHYGSRMPMNPLSLPFVHNKITIGNLTIPSYVDWLQLPYFRAPGLEDVKRYDIVVFNYPAHDIHDLRDGAGRVKPISMKENYIKRCVGMPGDTFELRDQQIYINGEPAWNPTNMQYEYLFETQDGELGFTREEMREMGFRTRDDKRYDQDPDRYEERVLEVPPTENRNWWPQHPGFIVHAPESIYEKIKAAPDVKSIFPIYQKAGELAPRGGFGIREVYSIFPNDEGTFPHNRDNFGPIVLPKKGMTVSLTNKQNYVLYRRAIEAYEGHDLKVQNGKPYLDGKETDSYTFEMDYYFMIGDNRHNSEDSRFWGYVPENHIVGKPLFIFFSYESNFGIRWDRIGTGKIK